MSKSFHPFDDSQNEIKTLETMIRSAGSFVIPSEDLRPRTMERARDLGVQRKAMRHLAFAGIFSLAMWGASLAFLCSVDAFREASVTPSGEDLQRIVFEKSPASNSEHDWKLVEVFERLRHMRSKDPGVAPSRDIEAGFNLLWSFRMQRSASR